MTRYNYGLTTRTDVGLTNALQPYVNYTLTLDLGTTSAGNPNYVELRAGTNVLMVTTNGNLVENDLSANPLTMTFVAFPDNPYIGQTLGVRLYTDYDAFHSGRWYFDNLALYATDTSGDSTAPTPDPMGWVALPTSCENNSITMMATNAVDDNGVQYFFTNTVNGNVSGWQDSLIWVDMGLTPGVTNRYRVKARDLSANLNETAWSSEESAVCEAHIILYESFESPSILPSTAISFGTFPLPMNGWDINEELWNDARVGWPATPFGDQYAELRYDKETTLITNHVLEAEYTYRVTYNAGSADLDYGYAETESSWIKLVAGTNAVATNVMTTTTSDFSESGELEFIPAVDHTNLGEPLKIVISGDNVYHRHKALFDNIKVYAIPPDPKGTLLILR
jgi:hypothetical protein